MTYEFAFGPRVIGPQRTLFRLWAPNAQAVSLELAGRDAIPMTARNDGWFEVEADCGAGTRYRFGVDGTSVPDPASRLQDMDVHDPSVVTESEAYAWRHASWQGRPWHETVLYELHPGLCGGYAGISERLSELARLGITAIELMPIADFPGHRNWGYDGVLPYAPDTAYGSPDELRALIDTAHGLGMMVFLDVVYNHFGPDGNYLGQYAGDFFRSDINTPWGPAIDFRRPQVRQFFAENALYWLTEFRFDGLRFDAVHAIPDADWLDEMATFVRSRVEPGRHVHLVLENDDNAAHHLGQPFDAQWNDDSHHVLHVMLTGENDGYYRDYADEPAQRLARCLAEGFVYQGEPSPHRDGKKRGEPSGHLPPTAFVTFLQNHDQIGNRALGERLTALVDAHVPDERPNPLAAAVALQLLCPQIPMLFMGEEFASRAPFLYFTSHNEKLAEAVREGRRKEFAGFAAFGQQGGAISLPDPNARATFASSSPFEASPPDTDANLWYAYYGHLLDIRRMYVTPRLPGARSLGAEAVGSAAAVARWQMGDGAMLTLAVNLGAERVDAIAPLAGDVIFQSRRGPDATPLPLDALEPGTLVATLQQPDKAS